MRNSELRDYEPARLLSGIDRQRQLILQMHSVPMPCPSCGTKQNVFEALRIDIDDYDTSKSGEKIVECIGCDRQLRYVVPFVSMGGPGWHWSLVPIAPTKVKEEAHED